MKNDINLFIKRQNSKNRKKFMVGLLIGAVFLFVFVAVGVLLPMNNRANAQLKLDALDQQLSVLDFTEQSLADNTAKNAQLTQQLDDLKRLHESRSDILAYLAGIENALPTSAQITYLSLTGNQLQITGIAPGDAELASFSLHLKESGLFSGVFVTTSTIPEHNENTMFTLTAALPVSLSGEAVVEEGSEDTAETGTADAASEDAPAQTEEVTP